MTSANPWLIGTGEWEKPARVAPAIEQSWQVWVPAMIPGMGSAPMGPHHSEYWDWIWSIRDGVRPDQACINIWARGGAKSSSAEGGIVALGARRTRRFVLYVSSTQEQADDHVSNIAELLGGSALEQEYPELCDRAVDKFGSSKGWRRNRLRTKSGLTVDALGLDSRVRGIKLEDARPDMVCHEAGKV